MSNVGITVDERMYDHKISKEVYETPERLRHLYLHLDEFEYYNELIKFPCKLINNKDLLKVHSQFYIDLATKACVKDNPYSYDKDTYFMEDSLYVAKLAAGGCLNLADAIMKGLMDRGFALIRPPGHHAEAGRGRGFCIFNNIANPGDRTT